MIAGVSPTRSRARTYQMVCLWPSVARPPRPTPDTVSAAAVTATRTTTGTIWSMSTG
ncbi:hypothetical protein ACFQX7_11150 [Luedemannella flava]